MTLDQLEPCQAAVVKKLKNNGPDRRRMLDMGILPGTQIAIEMVSPLGDPVAYRVRGAVVALRRQQARQIEIQLVEETTS